MRSLIEGIIQAFISTPSNLVSEDLILTNEDYISISHFLDKKRI